MITFPVAPIASAPSLHHTRRLVETLAHAGSEAICCSASTTGLFTQKLSPTRANASGSEERAMDTPFDIDPTTPAQDVLVLGRAVHPGYIDLPYVHEEILRGDRQDFGATLKIEDLGVAEVLALEANLADYERDVRTQIASMRRAIDERIYALDVTGQLTLGIAA